MMAFASFDRFWFLTWTTYGTWLPGDQRGFVSPKFEGQVPERRNNTVGQPYDRDRPELWRLARSKLVGNPVLLSLEHAEVLHRQFEETASFRQWGIVAGAIMANHVHLVVGVPGDPEPANLMRDFKSYGSRALNRRFTKPESGTWWTEQGSKRKVGDAKHLDAVVGYVRRQERPLVIWQRGESGTGGGQGANAPRSP